MNKIMGGMSMSSRVVSGAAPLSAARPAGVEAADVFKDILAAAASSEKHDIRLTKLARAWKCDVEQVFARAVLRACCACSLSLCF
jgi:hypothetical protein